MITVPADAIIRLFTRQSVGNADDIASSSVRTDRNMRALHLLASVAQIAPFFVLQAVSQEAWEMV
jgi:hypothetical protein